MGGASSKKAEMASENPATSNENLESYKLRHPGTCSGMFWRKDPRPDASSRKQKGGEDWPRNGSILN
eukprot:2150811-Ditylum_brightwellii.AAC.1